jgi:protein-disulfide isomerase
MAAMAAANDGKSSARQKIEQARLAEAVAARRRRQIYITLAVAAVIVALVGIGILVQHKKAAGDDQLGTGPLVSPSGAVADGTAIPLGDQNAKVTLTIYEDFRCPYCRMAEQTYESVYKSFAAAGTVRVQYHLVNLIDRNLGGTGSIRSGNAGACAQDSGKFEAYHDVLYTNQPDETDDAFGSNDKLISLAKQVPGLDTPVFEKCVNDGRHGSWVVANFDALSKLLGGSVATPYYAINGTQYSSTAQATPAAQASFKAALDKAVAAAG